MQNLGSAYRDAIRDDDRIYVPAGKARVAFVDTRNVATIAVDALVDPKMHAGKVYTLTGSEALSFGKVAELLSTELNRTIKYRPASIPGYIAHMMQSGLPLAQALVQTILHVSLRFGQAEAVNATLADLLGHAPNSMRDYIHDQRSRWT